MLAEEKSVQLTVPWIGLLQAAFILLKCAGLTQIAEWPWWKVLLPSILVLGVAATILLVAAGIGLAALLVGRRANSFRA